MILDSIGNLDAPEAWALKQIKALFCDPARKEALAAFVEGRAIMFIDDADGSLDVVPVSNPAADDSDAALPVVEDDFGSFRVDCRGNGLN